MSAGVAVLALVLAGFLSHATIQFKKSYERMQGGPP